METMNPLLIVEHRLGTTETWPLYIIRFLFLNCPKPQIIKKITAFFYGNGISLSLAIRLIKSVTINTLLLLLAQWVTYIWNGRRIDSNPTFKYYDVQRRRFLWINGSSLNQTEIVQPDVPVMDFGIDRCYSQHAAEIRQSMETTGGVNWVMVFGFDGSYVQHIIHSVWIESKKYMFCKLFFFAEVLTVI